MTTFQVTTLVLAVVSFILRFVRPVSLLALFAASVLQWRRTRSGAAACFAAACLAALPANLMSLLVWGFSFDASAQRLAAAARMRGWIPDRLLLQVALCMAALGGVIAIISAVRDRRRGTKAQDGSRGCVPGGAGKG